MTVSLLVLALTMTTSTMTAAAFLLPLPTYPVPACGGAVVHGLFASSSSSPSTPPSPQADLVTTLAADGRFTRLVPLLKTAGLDITLRSPGPWTLLAPTDAALDDIGTNLTLSMAAREPRRHLAPLLSYHIIPGKAMGLTELVAAGDTRSRIKTLERSGLSIAVYGGTILIDEARVTEWGNEASNGVIHVLDSLLLPCLPADFNPYESAEAAAEGPVLGVTPPLGLWDPLGLWKDEDKDTQTRFRKAEIKHARLAMLASVGVLGQEALLPGHPPALSALLKMGEEHSAATAAMTSAMSSLSPLLPIAVAFLPGVIYEVYFNLVKAGREERSVLGQKEEALTRILRQESPDFEEERETKRQEVALGNKELNNGRLAMMAVVGMLAQELVTGRGIWDWGS